MRRRNLWGLKTKVWANIVIIALMVSIPAAVGFQVKSSEKAMVGVNRAIKLQAYAQTVKYIQPKLAGLEDQQRARTIIKKIWGKDAQTGITLAICESGLQEKIIGKATHDVGYFQINPIHGWSDSEMQNGVANSLYAYKMYKEQGLNPWMSSKSCWSEKI